MSKCYSKRKIECINDCKWEIGKGCKNNKDDNDIKEVIEVKVKICPEGKILNPKTNRCIKDIKNKDIKEKICPEGKILNPKSNRCIKIKVDKTNMEVKTEEINKCDDNKNIFPDMKTCGDIKLLGSGTYGCVITPPITDEKYVKLSNYIDRDNSDIGKIFKGSGDLRSYKEEYNFDKNINIIDPNGIFTVKLKGGSEIILDGIQKNRKLMDCIKRKKTKYYQIIKEYGGIEISEENYTITFNSFIKMFKTFIDGFILLNNNKIVHRDIKPINVLIQIKNNEYKLNLIDFGLMTNFNNVYNGTNISVLKYAIRYKFYPPEFYIAFILLINYKNNIQEALIDDNIIKLMVKDGYFNQSYLQYNGTIKDRYIKEIVEFITEIKNKGFTKYNEIFNEKLAEKIDIFSLSFIIASLNKHIQYENQEQRNIVSAIYNLCSVANPYKRISVYDLSLYITKIYDILP